MFCTRGHKDKRGRGSATAPVWTVKRVSKKYSWTSVPCSESVKPLFQVGTTRKSFQRSFQVSTGWTVWLTGTLIAVTPDDR